VCSSDLTRRRTTYTNLPPGSYVFRVTACNNHGIWSGQGASLTLGLEPFYYETTEFFVLCIGTVLALALGVHFYRLRIVSTHNSALRREIDERLRVERANAVLEVQLRRVHKLEAIGTLAGGIAHDFNNLLFAIRANTATIRRPGVTQERSANAICLIDEAAEQAGEIIRSLEIFSKQQVVELLPIDLAGFLPDALRTIEPSLGDGYILEIAIPEGQAFWVESNAGQLQQIVMNLVLNARDAMSDGGTIRVGLSSSKSSKNGESSGVVMSVTDTGVGIAESIVPHLFDPFFTTKDVGEGLGLGLSISYNIIKDLGGTIKVRSNPEAGTTFLISLNRATELVPA